MEGRLCPICRVYKPLSEYGKRMRKGRNVGQAYCIPCKRIFDRENQRARREMAKLDRERSKRESQGNGGELH